MWELEILATVLFLAVFVRYVYLPNRYISKMVDRLDVMLAHFSDMSVKHTIEELETTLKIFNNIILLLLKLERKKEWYMITSINRIRVTQTKKSIISVMAIINSKIAIQRELER